MPRIYEHMNVKTGMTPVKEERMPFGWSINPYRGCAHGCSFCFARGFQHFMNLGADDEFQNHILLKTNAPEALEAQLAKLAVRHRYDLGEMRRRLGQVMIGTVTDPYQPVEGRMKLTRRCLEVLARYGVGVSVTTRSPLILRDLDLLRRMDGVSVNISMNTLDAKLTRRLEPEAPLPAKRLETLKALSEAGIRTSVFIAPILPLLTDGPKDLEELFAAAAERGAGSFMTSALRLSPEVKRGYFRSLAEHYPDRLDGYRELYAGGAYASDEYREKLRRLTDELSRKYTPSEPLYKPADEEEAPSGIRPGSPAPGEACGEPAYPPEQLSFF
ncbi:SPL family radical SAM protein [Paenibacillus glufosinatiresistens]|uniref:SPL family radical SAM protein n=1 Tax=Paenibacillus glufosinatiresistens TaxID=3070657 RepID=UPI00286E84A0|nr:radical SAM protein [Paenibacillus sp. YX.27]